jgi:hypothetical protein
LYFLDKAVVPWGDFSAALRSYGAAHVIGLPLSEADYVLLEAFYAQLLGGQLDADLHIQPPPQVSLERFGQLAFFFPHSDLRALLKDFTTLARASWFHGTVTILLVFTFVFDLYSCLSFNLYFDLYFYLYFDLTAALVGYMPLKHSIESIRGQPKGSFMIRLGQGMASGSVSVTRMSTLLSHSYHS